jgi:predicted GNAT family acetyltransferase
LNDAYQTLNYTYRYTQKCLCGRFNSYLTPAKCFLYFYTMYQEIPLNNNTALHNFELFVDGQRAFIDYKVKDDKYYLVHTEVPPELEGRGVAAALVEKTLHYLEENGFKMLPYCSYIQAYLKRHPEWERLRA